MSLLTFALSFWAKHLIKATWITLSLEPRLLKIKGILKKSVDEESLQDYSPNVLNWHILIKFYMGNNVNNSTAKILSISYSTFIYGL